MIRVGEPEEIRLYPKQDKPWLVSRVITHDRYGLPARAALYSAPNAPKEALDLLRRTPRDAQLVYRTTQNRVFRHGSLVLKTMHDRTAAERWERTSGIAALAMNVVLHDGLGGASRLPNGYQVIAPRYYGALLLPGRHQARWVMSFEFGNKITDKNEYLTSTSEARQVLYDAALTAGGVDPAAQWYDDGDYNLLVRPSEHKLIKLDALSAWSHNTLMGNA